MCIMFNTCPNFFICFNNWTIWTRWDTLKKHPIWFSYYFSSSSPIHYFSFFYIVPFVFLSIFLSILIFVFSVISSTFLWPLPFSFHVFAPWFSSPFLSRENGEVKEVTKRKKNGRSKVLSGKRKRRRRKKTKVMVATWSFFSWQLENLLL